MMQGDHEILAIANISDVRGASLGRQNWPFIHVTIYDTLLHKAL